MAGNPHNAVDERIKKANQIWRQVNQKSFRNKAIGVEIKISLWGSRIRRAGIYGLRAEDLSRKLFRKMEACMYKRIRTMVNHRWKLEERYQGKKQLYRTLMKSTMESRFNKRG